MTPNNYKEEANNYAAKKLREFRLKRKLTRVELSEKLNLAHQQIQKYESGRDRIAIGTLALICEALKVKPNAFFERF